MVVSRCARGAVGSSFGRGARGVASRSARSLASAPTSSILRDGANGSTVHTLFVLATTTFDAVVELFGTGAGPGVEGADECGGDVGIANDKRSRIRRTC